MTDIPIIGAGQNVNIILAKEDLIGGFVSTQTFNAIEKHNVGEILKFIVSVKESITELSTKVYILEAENKKLNEALCKRSKGTARKSSKKD